MWDVDSAGNIVWREGATRSDLQAGKIGGVVQPGSSFGQELLGRRAGSENPFRPVNVDVSGSTDFLTDWSTPTGWNAGARTSRTDAERLAALARSMGGVVPAGVLPDLSTVFGDDPADVPSDPFAPSGGGQTATGYSPSLVDTRAAEAMLNFQETAGERAAIEALLADLEARGTAGVQAVRGGWSQVQAVNAAAAQKAQQLARDAGPEAARLWSQAAADVLNLSAGVAQTLGTTPGMQRVNISPTAGSEQIAALLAAEAPRAQQLAERMGLASAEQIAAQARTASMMGEAYGGEIQRTMLIQANQARQAHNQRVLDRIAGERQMAAQMRFQAATTNAQLLSSAAAAAASGAKDEPTRRQRVREFVDDVERFATFEKVSDGAGMLMQIYPVDAATAESLINSAKQGLLDYRAALAAIGNP